MNQIEVKRLFSARVRLCALAGCACWMVPSCGGFFLRSIVPIGAVAPAEEACHRGHANNDTHYSPPFLQSLKGDASCLAQGLM